MSYGVKSGDTLSSIASANGLSLSELIALNPQISNPDLIFPGQVINTAPANQPSSESSANPLVAELVQKCPQKQKPDVSKISLIGLSDDAILAVLKEQCANVSQVPTTKKAPPTISVPDKRATIINIKNCLSKFSGDVAEEALVKEILEHWARNEINEMPVYDGEFKDFENLFALHGDGYTIGKYPPEEALFHTNVTDNASKYYVIDKDGKRTGWEYVFNGKGEIVTDIRDAGTYNIVPPSGSPTAKWGHKVADVNPYSKWGSGPADTITPDKFDAKVDKSIEEGIKNDPVGTAGIGLALGGSFVAYKAEKAASSVATKTKEVAAAAAKKGAELMNDAKKWYDSW